MRAITLISGVAACWIIAGCGSSNAPGGDAQIGGANSTTSTAKDGSGGNGGGSNSSGIGGDTTSSTKTTASSAAPGGGAAATGGAVGNGGKSAAGGAPIGGVTASGGRSGAGGASASGGASAKGGASASGGASAAGGASAKGGASAAGGASAKAGASASGGAPASGGIVSSGGAVGSGGATGAGGGSTTATAPTTYEGPCDLVAGGCAEAYGMARAMTAKYTGPLFQLGLNSDKSKTLDIAQTADRKADMTTWSAFCGGNQSNCVVSKIYAQIHTGPNDLLPAVWNAPWGPDCSAGGYKCAAKFTIESSTSLPILSTDAPQEYALRTNNTENLSTGINGGNKAIGLMYNGKPVANQVYCCGTFGITHKYNEEDIYGTDFMVALAYGWRDSGGCCIAVNCGASNKYCVGSEEEENNNLVDYGSSPIENAMVVTQIDPSKNTVISYLNGKQMISEPPKVAIKAGTAIHVGGGGDLSQPDPVRMREALITNAVMTASEVAAMKANITAFFPMLNFPTP